MSSAEKVALNMRRPVWYKLSGLLIALLNINAIAAPLRADILRDGSLRLEFAWTQLQRLRGGLNWGNAEILFPLGAFVLLLVSICFVVQSLKWRGQYSLRACLSCLIAQVLFRGFVDFYLVTTYFPFGGLTVRGITTVWPMLAFVGGGSSVLSIVIQLAVLIRTHKLKYALRVVQTDRSAH